jgi:hypothetical protein
MRSITGLAIAAVLAAGIGIAKANVYSYTTPVLGETSASTDSTNFTPASFNGSLGHLTDVSLTLVGSLNISETILVQPNGPQPQKGLYFETLATAYGDGTYPPNSFGQNPQTFREPGVIGTQYVTAQEQVAASFAIESQFIGDYVGNGTADSNLTGLAEFNSRAYMPDGNPYGIQTFSESAHTYFTGQLIETFTYDPVPVPEPGSLALLGTAGLLLAGAMRLSKRRNRS